MTGWSHPVASFWAGGDLSFIEQMVIRSYLDQGAEFTLYLGNPVSGIPDGVDVRDAAEIMAKPADIGDQPDRKALATWSDLFRVHLLIQRRVFWVDLDAYCVRPFDLPQGYAFGDNTHGGALSGVIALPQDAPALLWMGEFLAREEYELPWLDSELLAKKRKQGKLRLANLAWGDIGPRLLTHALNQSGEIAHLLPAHIFYPVSTTSLPRIWRPAISEDLIIRPETLSVHIFGYTKRFLTTYHAGLPPEDSWLARTAARHGIDPGAAPAWAEPLQQK